MHSPSSVTTNAPVDTPHLLADGSYVVLHGFQEIEIWGANISEHYTVRVAANDMTKLDIVFLGASPTVPS